MSMLSTRPTSPLSASAALAAAFLLTACAGSKSGTQVERKSAGGGDAPVKVEEGADLPSLAKAVRTREDSLVLDMLIGYRMLLVGTPDASKLDGETLKRSRKAFEHLEYDLRHGGIRRSDAGERLYSISDEDKLSLQEVLRSVSASAGKSARAGDWEKAKARWREVLQSKPAVAWTMEEASWGLTLADALASNLPDPIKKKLKDVDESYAREVSQDDIARQVKDLLNETIQDDKLRRELKKLANRAWERDKRAGRLTASQPTAQTVPASDSLPTAQAGFGSPTQPAVPAAPAGTPPETAAGMGKVDTLISQGKYLPALRGLEGLAGADAVWIKDRRGQIGDRYCEDKRKAAANGFKDFKKANNDAERAGHLRRTAADLDSCLFYFPDNPVALKVRRNREMVETEMKKLKP